MSFLLVWRRVAAVLVFGIFLAGCIPSPNQGVAEEKEHYFVKGQTLLSSMDYDGAAQCFEKALEVNPHSASAHFELGVLDMQHQNDYAAAIYHFEQHLKLQPNSRFADVVRQQITACKLALAKDVSLGLRMPQVQKEFDRLTTENRNLREQVDQLKLQMAQAQQQTARAAAPPPAKAPDLSARAEVTPAVMAARVPGPGKVAAAPLARANADLPGEKEDASGRAASHSPTNKSPNGSRRAEANKPAASAETPKIAILGHYTAQRGDSLRSVARKFGVELKRLEAANPGLKQLRPGEVVKIPAR